MSRLERKSIIFIGLVVSLICPNLTKAIEDGTNEDSSREQPLTNGKEPNPYVFSLLDRNDYHSNIDLNDVIQDAPKYSLIDGRAGRQQPRWFTDLQRANRFSRSPLVSRSFKEDNDLGASGSIQQKLHRINREYPLGMMGDKQLLNPGKESEIWAMDVISGLLQAEEQQRQGIQQNRFRSSPNQISQQQSLSNDLPRREQNNPLSSDEFTRKGFQMGTDREKRRRCKSDPNLSVKNPSFCDTDAYFGAADYSMRDVWDTAGR